MELWPSRELFQLPGRFFFGPSEYLSSPEQKLPFPGPGKTKKVAGKLIFLAGATNNSPGSQYFKREEQISLREADILSGEIKYSPGKPKF